MNYTFGKKGHGFEDRIVRDLHKTKVPFLYEPYALEYGAPILQGKCLDCDSYNVVQVKRYVPDFVSMDGKIVVEAKGNFTPVMRTKMAAVVRDNPNVIIRMLFQRNNWITTKHKRKYSDWCDAKGIAWAVGYKFPTAWKKDFRLAKHRGIQQ
jgi:hypothetical protein